MTVIHAICPHCDKTITVRKDGTIRSHHRPRAHRNELFPPLCPGTGWQAYDPSYVLAATSGLPEEHR